MVKRFLCGALPPEADDESPGPPSPRKCRAGSRCVTKNNNKNPYSARGLDKFSCLLAELEEKRQKIYSQMDSQDIIVRFVYKNADDCVPVVVKPKDRKDDKNKVDATKMKNKMISSEAMAEPVASKPSETETNGPISVSETGQRSEKKNSSLIMKVKRWRRPSNYLPAIIILILLLMALFGRSMAILFTSIGWYVVPSMKETSTSKRPTKKKDLARRYSDTRIIVNGSPSPRRNSIAGAEKDEKSHRWLGHQRSF